MITDFYFFHGNQAKVKQQIKSKCYTKQRRSVHFKHFYILVSLMTYHVLGHTGTQNIMTSKFGELKHWLLLKPGPGP